MLFKDFLTIFSRSIISIYVWVKFFVRKIEKINFPLITLHSVHIYLVGLDSDFHFFVSSADLRVEDWFDFQRVIIIHFENYSLFLLHRVL